MQVNLGSAPYIHAPTALLPEERVGGWEGSRADLDAMKKGQFSALPGAIPSDRSLK
jgi:hypothetical protein